MYIVARKDKLFYHFGIRTSRNKVLHYASKTNDMFASDQMVRCDCFEDFAINRKVRVICKIEGINKNSIMERAKSYWGNNKKYSLRDNNCILFVLWCLHIEEERCFSTLIKYYFRFLSMPMIAL